jgi:hypothetical protein
MAVEGKKENGDKSVCSDNILFKLEGDNYFVVAVTKLLSLEENSMLRNRFVCPFYEKEVCCSEDSNEPDVVKLPDGTTEYKMVSKLTDFILLEY